MEEEVYHKKAPGDSDWVPSQEKATSDSEEEDESRKGLYDGSEGGGSHAESSKDDINADAHSSVSKNHNQRPESRFRRPGSYPPHSEGGQPDKSKKAVKPMKKGKAAAKPLKKGKAVEPISKAPDNSTSSRTKTALAADKTESE